MTRNRRVAVVCGTRNALTRQQIAQIAPYVRELDHLIVGDATGVDGAARNAAVATDIPHTVYAADWSNGKRGGPERNIRMAEAAVTEKLWGGADVYVVAFPGGKGTASMKREAAKRGIKVVEVEWDNG